MVEFLLKNIEVILSRLEEVDVGYEVDVLHDSEGPPFYRRQPKFMSFKISPNTQEIRAFMLIKV